MALNTFVRAALEKAVNELNGALAVNDSRAVYHIKKAKKLLDFVSA